MSQRWTHDQYLWQCHVCVDYQPGKSIMLFKVHHSLTDGMGLITFLAFMNSDDDKNLIPKMKRMSKWQTFIARALTPYFIAVGMYKMGQVQGTTETHPLEKKPFTGVKEVYTTKKYEFSKLRVYKKWDKCTFNHLIVTIISKLIGKMFEECGSKAKRIVASFPVNMRYPPTSLSEVELSNSMASAKIEIPFVKSVE